jgi:hypothetical protein
MPARTLFDDFQKETAEDKRREDDRVNGDRRLKEWGRRWAEVRRRGGVDREQDWYANNRRYSK